MSEIQSDASRSFPLWNHFIRLHSLRQWYCFTLHPISKWFENCLDWNFAQPMMAVLSCTKFQNDLTTEKYVMHKRSSARFMLKMDRRDIYCKITQIPTFLFLVETFLSDSYFLVFLNVFKLIPVSSFTKGGNPRLAKGPLVLNGCLANRGLTSLVKEATCGPVSYKLSLGQVMSWHQTKQPVHIRQHFSKLFSLWI